MKKLIMLFMILSLVACGNETENTNSSDPATAETKSTKQQKTQKKASTEMPNLADYQGECPKNWGIVPGAARAHVDKFIQNFIFVPENPGPMYSEIVEFPQADGSILLKSSTYNMADDIVDQEMITIFNAGIMSQCNVRFHCAADVKTWVNTCDKY